ncbi:hypothetical protein GCM10008968_36210 [Bacillus horti]
MVQFSDTTPVIQDNRVLVPIRAIVEAMGAKADWNSAQRRAEISLNERKVHVPLQLPYIQKYQSSNGGTYSHVLNIETPSTLLQNRTMVPLRAVGEALGYQVEWNSTTQTATYTQGLRQSTYTQYGIIGDISELQQREIDVFWQVNQKRAENNVSPLSLHIPLSRVAKEKSRDMHSEQYFDHTSPTYGSPFDMMRHFGISFQAAGENIAAGYQQADQVMNGWMNSDGHRRNILSDNFSFIGVGYHYGNSGYNHYWTQMFMK